MRYFVQKFARRMNKRIDDHSVGDDDALAEVAVAGQHPRARERHRAGGDPVARLDARGAARRTESAPPTCVVETAASGRRRSTTLEEIEREHIRRVLDETNWLVGGPYGAAARLGMKRTTLQSKIARLGIQRTDGR